MTCLIWLHGLPISAPNAPYSISVLLPHTHVRYIYCYMTSFHHLEPMYCYVIYVIVSQWGNVPWGCNAIMESILTIVKLKSPQET